MNPPFDQLSFYIFFYVREVIEIQTFGFTIIIRIKRGE